MKQLKAMFLIPLLAAGCSSSPTAPSVTVPAGAPRVGLSMRLLVSPSGPSGFTAPTSLTLQIQSGGTPVHVETVSYRMLDARGQVLVEAFIDAATAGNSDPSRYVSGDTVVQTFSWPAERGTGVKIDVILTYRDAAGVLSTYPFSVPAQ